MPTLRQLISSSRALHTLLGAALAALSGMAAAATPQGTAAVSQAADPWGLGRVYNLPNAGTAPVNLLTGDAQFTLPLGAISGRNGLSYTLSARYSSNVMTQAKAWNGDQPTGVMGLGWTFDYPKVVVDTHGQTQQSSDDYFLDMNGQRSRLIPSGKDTSGNITYTADSFANWRITYVAGALRWDMVDERGTAYVFGDSDVNAAQSTLQTLAVWLADTTTPAPSYGPSIMPPTGSRPVVFNLARIVEPWGDALTFSYLSLKAPLRGGGSYADAFVRESYLKSIKNSFGDSLQLTYGAKLSTTGTQEYVTPHAYATDGSTAYQDRFETQFLASVASFKNGQGSADQTVQLSYGGYLNVNGNAAYAKRTLASAYTANSAGRAATPSTRFDYYNAVGDPNYGAVRSITSPSGSVQTYTYQVVNPALAQLSVAVPFDTNAKTWIGENVVVAMSPVSGQTKIFSWQGRWVTALDLGNLPTSAKVRVGKDTIGILYKRTSGCAAAVDPAGACPVVLALHRDAGKETWSKYEFVIGQPGSVFANGALLPVYDSFDMDAGTDLVTLAAPKGASDSPGLYVPAFLQLRYWSGGFNAGQSQGSTPFGSGLSSAPAQATVRMRDTKAVAWFYGSGGGAYAVVQPDAGGNTGYSFQPAPSLPPFAPSTVDLEVGDGFFVVKDAQCNSDQRVWMVGTEVGNTATAKAISTSIGSNCANPIAISDRTVAIGSFLYQIRGSAPAPGGSAFVADGPEFALAPGTNEGVTYSSLNNQWTAIALPGPVAQAAAGRGLLGVALGGGAGTTTYWRSPTDTWAPGSPLDANAATAVMSGRKGLLRYNFANGGKAAYVGSNALDTPAFASVGATVLSNDFRAGNSTVGDLIYVDNTNAGKPAVLNLTRVRDVMPYQLGGAHPVAVVAKIVSTTGYESVANASAPSRTTQYVYDTSNATMDPTGRYARFNHVTVRKGAGTAGSTDKNDLHYGYTDLWQWNGQADSTPNFTALPSGNEATTYSKLDGRPYYVESWREAYTNGQWTSDAAVGKGWTWYTTTIKDANPDSGYVGGLTAYTRTAYAQSQRDGTAKISASYSYLDASAGDMEGMLKSTQTVSLNANNESETVSTTYTYAAQVYSNWNAGAHMLSPLAGVLTRRTDTNQILSNVATTYKAWGGNPATWTIWGPVASYSWQRGAQSSTFNYTTPNADWLPGPAIDAVNNAGGVTQTKYSYNTPATTLVSSVLYDKDNRFGVASFGDAVVNGNAHYWGVEGYETAGSANGWTAPTGFNVVTGNANTGKQSLSVSGNLYRDVSSIATGAGAVYVFSTWVNVPANVSVTLQLKGWMNGQNTVSAQREFTPDASQVNTWQYVEVYLPDTGIAGVSPWLSVAGGAALVDDLRFGPSESPFAATVFDLDRGVVTATLGSNGEVRRALYDEFQRPVAAVAPGGSPVASAVSYASRSGNNDSFNPSDPNSLASVAARGVADHADFSSANPAPGKWKCTSGSCSPTAQGLSMNGTITMATPVSYQNAVRAQIDYGATSTSAAQYKIQIGSGGSTTGCTTFGAGAGLFNGNWRLYMCGSVLAQVAESRPLDQIPRDWFFYHAGNRLIFFVGGRKIFDKVVNTPQVSVDSTWPIVIGTDNGSPMTLRNVAVFNDPTFGGSFFDAAGRLLHSTAVVDDSNTVTASGGALYNANWTRTLQAKAVAYAGAASGFSYVPGYVQRDANGNLVGDAAAAYMQNTDTGYTNDGGYPYDGIADLAEPPSRLSTSGAAGTDYSPNSPSGKPSTFSYGANGNDPANGMPPFLGQNRTAYPSGQFPLSTDKQPVSADGMGTVSMLTTQSLSTPPGASIGSMVVGATAYMQSPVSLQTLRQQDNVDRTSALYHPRYFAPTGTEQQPDVFKTTLGYNPYDRVSQVTLPNSGMTQIIYNKIGQLRFWMDANGQAASLNRTSYRKYDRFGRVIEEGYTCGTFNAATLQAQAEDASQPVSSPLTWRRRYQYGVQPGVASSATGVNIYSKGRLTAVLTNSGPDSGSSTPADPCDATQKPAPNDSQVVTYDERGRLAAVLENTRPYLDGLLTTYAYNNLGQVTAIGNPAALGAGAVDQGATSTVPAAGGQVTSVAKYQVDNNLSKNSYGLSTPQLAVLLAGATYAGPVAYTACLANLPACAFIVGGAATAVAVDYLLKAPMTINVDSQSGTNANFGKLGIDAGGYLQVNAVPSLPMRSTTYRYDKLGQLAGIGRIVDGVAQKDYYATYRYGVNGELLTEVRNPSVAGNANINNDAPINLNYRYNSPGLLSSITATLAGNAVPAYKQQLFFSDAPAGFKTYDGRIGAMQQSFNPFPAVNQTTTLNQNFSYFPEGGIKQVLSSGTFSAGGINASGFDFAINNKDANGNLRSIKHGAATTTYDFVVRPDSDRLQMVTRGPGGQVKSGYLYDPNGNVVQKTNHIVGILYDPYYNRPVSIQHETQGSQQRYAMRYGGSMGDRVWQTYYDSNQNVQVENTYFRGGGDNPLAIQYDTAPTPTAPSKVSRKTMVWGPTGLVAVTDDNQGTANDYFVVPNHQGSTVQVWQKGSFAATVKQYAYTPTGNIYQPDGTLVRSDQVVPFLFQGAEYDWQSELHDFGLRSYDSDMVNFLQPDPQFSVGQSPYVAMDNDPVN